MAQINLLKQNTAASGNFKNNIPNILIRLFLAVLPLLFVYYGWLFIDSKSTDNKIAAAQTKINNDRATALAAKNRSELLTRQLQLKSLGGLIGSHIYWSQLFQPLAASTLKLSSYSTLRVGSGDDLTLSATVPSLSDLDKYMQIFDLPQFNQNFSDVRIGGFSKAQDKNSTSIKFEVRMKYDPKIIEYKSTNIIQDQDANNNVR